ncbi:hypothetical protein [Photobacterium sp. R1]
MTEGKIMFRKSIAFAATLILSGCVSTNNIPIDEAKLTSAQPKSITVTQREKPDFSAMTAGKAYLGIFGAAAMISEGNEIVEQNHVEDPASYISQTLRKVLAQKYQLSVAESQQLIDSDDAADIAQAYHNADLILDIETINWSFVYYPTDWDNYRVIYSAKLRLVDARNESILAEGFCARVPEEEESAPSYEALLENNASILKSELRSAADHCIQEFEHNVLAI